MVHTFTTIQNFRDVGESIPGLAGKKVCRQLLYRSATLDLASDEELERLVKDLQTKTILDLRSEMEAKLTHLGKPFLSFPIAASLKMDPGDVLDPAPPPEKVRVLLERHHKSQKNGNSPQYPRKTFMVNFAGQKFRKHAAWFPAPFWCKVRIAGLVLSGQKGQAAKVVGVEVINKKGLEGLYRDFIDYCDEEINEALHILADPGNYPILVHCTHGKDRTGIVVALALAAVGVDEEEICEDYAKSTEGLKKVHPVLIEELSRNGLDPAFAETPIEVMRDTFEYIKSKYGSIEEYLDGIGFGEKQRELLSMILVDERHCKQQLTPDH